MDFTRTKGSYGKTKGTYKRTCRCNGTRGAGWSGQAQGKGYAADRGVKVRGKNFSCNNASGKRKVSDFYETPYALTRLLLRREKLKGRILEPACGSGAIVDVLDEFGYNPCYYDLYNGPVELSYDFFDEDFQYDTIITNPPFSKALEFIRKAKTISKKFIFLLPLSYLHGKERLDSVWADKKFPLKKVYVFSRYPLLEDRVREDGKHKTGMMVYAWYVWEKGYWGKPKIEWLDNNEFVVYGKRGEKGHEDAVEVD